MMKKLLIYKTDDTFVIEKVDELNHGIKKNYMSENELLDGLQDYKPVLDEYELNVSDDLWPKVINFLNSKDF